MATLARRKEARPRRASRLNPHRRGGHRRRRRRRHRALLGGAARIAHPSPLGLIRSGCLFGGEIFLAPRENASHESKTHPISTVTLMKEQEEEKGVSVADRDSSNPGRQLHAHFTQESTLQTAPCAAAASSRPAASLVRFFHRVQFTELSTVTSVQALFRRLIGPLTDVLAC
uniref:Uncharacterized protein n=1 Tax=Oryza meridionalis TaxID=40149 RepID=A0A0E0ELS3_9ORYZ